MGIATTINIQAKKMYKGEMIMTTITTNIKPRAYGEHNKPIINPGEAHLPVVLLVDTSYSMERVKEKIRQALIDFGEAIKDDERAVGTAEIMIITFDSEARVIEPFGSAYDYEVPEIKCYGMTAMHSAVDLALKEIEARKKQYGQDINYYRPWLYLITDGKPNDEDNGAFERLLQAQTDKHCIFFPIALGDTADLKLLGTLREDHLVFKASKEDFAKAFEWLSNSIITASNSHTGDIITLEDPINYGIKPIQIPVEI